MKALATARRLALLVVTPRTAPRPARTGLLLAGGCLATFSFGTPSGCLGVLASDAAPTGTTSTTLGSASNPEQVLRDNLAFGGTLNFTDTSVYATLGHSADNSDSTWTGGGHTNPTLTGYGEISESRGQGTHYLNQYTPLLPHASLSGGSSVAYGQRAGTMVHGNTYAISMEATETANGQATSLSNTTYVQLSPTVMLVPIVIVNWHQPSGQSYNGYNFTDQTISARNTFDFNPVYIPNQSKPDPYTTLMVSLTGPAFTVSIQPLPYSPTEALTASTYTSPTASLFAGHNAADGWQVPPDDLWTNCNIQFQVVAQVEATLAPNDGNGGWSNRCNDGAVNLGGIDQIQAAVAAQFANQPTLRDRILYDLAPIYVSYGDLHGCKFDGNTPGKASIVEISTVGAGNTTLAHELGHALQLEHEWLDKSTNPPTSYSAASTPEATPPDFSNLMAATGNTASGSIGLLPAQCTAARGNAAAYSSRFDYFNSVTGRTGHFGFPPPPKQVYSAAPAPSTPLSEVCCLQSGIAGIVSTTCSTANTLPIAQCNSVCCTVGTSAATSVTQYQCTQEGGTVSASGCGSSTPQ